MWHEEAPISDFQGQILLQLMLTQRKKRLALLDGAFWQPVSLPMQSRHFSL